MMVEEEKASSLMVTHLAGTVGLSTVLCVTVTENFFSRRGPKTEMLISGMKEEQFYSSTPRGAFYLLWYVA